MKASKNAINIIKKYEGCRLNAYKCPAGVWTIGYGHTKNVKEGDKITQEQADAFLINDIEKFEKKVNKYMHIYNFNQNQYDALVSFAFNLGSIDQLTRNGTRTKDVISKKILEYNKASGKLLNGLVRRRKEEKALFDKDFEIKELQKIEKSVDDIAKEVISGKWGNGTIRKTKLEKAGYVYKTIQKKVNEILRGDKNG